MAIITLNNNSLSSVTALPTGVGGKVLQAVQTTTATALTTTSNSFVDINLSATITPSSASSKILMLFTSDIRSTSDGNGCVLTIFRGSIASGTNLGASNWGFGQIDKGSGGLITFSAITYLDSPNTTSAITYTPAGKANAGTSLITAWGGSRASFILMEIEG
jgi:hypothetical protein